MNHVLYAALLTLACVATPAALAQSKSIAGANAAATQGPNDAALVGALHEFAFETGGLYAIQSSPQRITDIGLEPGETLLSVSAGDTTRWIVGDARSGAGASGQSHVLVKPNAPSLATNLVIMTDRRVYHVELKSVAGAAMAAVSWRYPAALTLASAPPPPPESEAVFTPAALHLDYRIKGARPDWRPLRAFDDGRQVFIEMAEGFKAMEAPPLFIIGEDGDELVNYRLDGRFYVVDRLFRRGEMRLGKRKVQILRDGPMPGVTGGAHD